MFETSFLMDSIVCLAGQSVAPGSQSVPPNLRLVLRLALASGGDAFPGSHVSPATHPRNVADLRPPEEAETFGSR